MHHHLRVTSLATLTTLLAFAFGCGDYVYTPGFPTPEVTKHDLVINGSGFDEHEGFLVLFRIENGPELLFCGNAGPVTDGAFTLSADGVLPEGAEADAEVIGKVGEGDTYEEGADRVYVMVFGVVAGDVAFDGTPEEGEIRGWTDGQPACGN